MRFHVNLLYNDILKANKIIVTEDMLKMFKQYYIMNFVSNFVKYDFKTLNIEFDLKEVINVYIENIDEDYAVVTIFHNKKKLVSFLMEYILDIGFSVVEITEYPTLARYKESAEELILFAIEWYPAILFYIQAHSSGWASRIKNCTFFINTKNSKLEI